jgi:hypothetical protein
MGRYARRTKRFDNSRRCDLAPYKIFTQTRAARELTREEHRPQKQQSPLKGRACLGAKPMGISKPLAGPRFPKFGAYVKRGIAFPLTSWFAPVSGPFRAGCNSNPKGIIMKRFRHNAEYATDSLALNQSTETSASGRVDRNPGPRV